MRKKLQKRQGKVQLLSLLLTVSMLVTTQGFTSFANTVSQNGVAMEAGEMGNTTEAEQPEDTEQRSGEETKESDGMEEATDVCSPDGAGSNPGDAIQAGNVEEQTEEISGTGEESSIDSELLMQAASKAPDNPVHICVGENNGNKMYSWKDDETTQWSYVYFGSYPQSEIKDHSTIEMIEKAICQSESCASAGAEAGVVDLWVNGRKYRRISKDAVNSDDYFGNKQYRYFKWESIKWRILENDGNTLLLQADQALDCKNYNDTNVNVTWESSTIRSWLNGEFYNAAFNDREQASIVPQKLVNKDNEWNNYNTEGGNDTMDNVFLLSLDDIKNVAYGFCPYYLVYGTHSRYVGTSAYANANGTWEKNEYYIYSGGCNWWLRTPGKSSNYAAYVLEDGDEIPTGYCVTCNSLGVVPTIRIDLTSDAWSLKDQGIGKEGEIPESPVHSCNESANKVDTTTWNYVYFGSYPQSEVTDSAVIAAIEGAIAESGQTGELGIDVWVDGEKYRRISKSDVAGSVDKFGDSVYRYFRWEPVKWRVLENDGASLLIMSDQSIDCKYYDDGKGKTTWADSTIRSWLNGTFYNTAFSGEEQASIVEQHNVTEGSSFEDVDCGRATTDRVFLLSLEEMTNEVYGFCCDYDMQTESRICLPSAYTKVRLSSENMYWLRSMGSDGWGALSESDGQIVFQPSTYQWGVVPALRISITSPCWSPAEENNSQNVLLPANPVHHCMVLESNTDTTRWSYVYFGSYPQTEVTDSATIGAIDRAIAASGQRADSGIDVWVNGTKYRRISKSDVSRKDAFGDNTYRYFQWERMRWKVLSKDGTTFLLLADQALDCKAYHSVEEGVTWEDSTIRSWLNDCFYHIAFSVKEQESIVERNNVNADNDSYETKGGNDTKDKVFFLSLEEAINESYGFCNDPYKHTLSRQVLSTEYAIAQGLDTTTWGSCYWWLRTPGYMQYYASAVRDNGFTGGVGGVVSDEDGIVPALCIQQESDTIFLKDDGTSGDGGEEPVFSDLKVSKTKTTYVQGEHLNLDDLQVTAVYDYWLDAQKSTKQLSEDAYTTNASAIDMNTPGEKILTVSHTEKNCTKTADIKITVTQNTENLPGAGQAQSVKIKKLSIKAPSKKLAAGKKVQLTVKVQPDYAANKTVTWKTSNKKYATIDKNGKLTLKKAGAGKSVTVTATAKDGSGVKATYKIKIMKDAVKSVGVKAPSTSVKAGKSINLKTTVKTTGKSVNKTIKWTSSNTAYATVNQSGKVKTKKAGKGKTVTITATSTDGTNKKGKVKLKIK